MKTEKTLENLYIYLKQFHLSESLYLIGSINAALKYGLKGLYEENIPQNILIWLGRMSNNHKAKLNLYLNSTRLARFLILSGSNDYKKKVLKLEDNSFTNAVNMVGDLYDEPLEEQLKESSKDWINNIMGRISHWQFPLQEDRRISLGRANLLFNTIPNTLNLPYNFDDKMKEYYGISCFEFFATGFSLWLKSNGTLDYQLEIEIGSLKNIITKSNQLEFLKLSSGTPEHYRRKIRGENWKAINRIYDIYCIDPFMQMPAVVVQNSLKFKKDSYVVPQAKYLLDRASTGIFYLLADKEQDLNKLEGKQRGNPFRKCFGDVYRAYVWLQLKQISGASLIDLDNDFEHEQKNKIPDFALIDGAICILFEVKVSLLTASSRTFFDESQLKKEINKVDGSFKKALDQLDEFKSLILNKKMSDKRFERVQDVISVIVGYEDIFVLNSYLLPLLKESYNQKANDLQLASISDIEAIGCLTDNKLSIGQIFKDKINNQEMLAWPFMQYLQKYIKTNNEIVESSYENFFSVLISSFNEIV
jgi:hypothetical protein